MKNIPWQITFWTILLFVLDWSLKVLELQILEPTPVLGEICSTIKETEKKLISLLILLKVRFFENIFKINFLCKFSLLTGLTKPETTTASYHNYLENQYDFSSPEIHTIEATTKTDHYATKSFNSGFDNNFFDSGEKDNNFYKSHRRNEGKAKKPKNNNHLSYYHNSTTKISSSFRISMISFCISFALFVLLPVL